MSLGTRAVNRLRDLYAHVCHRTRRLNAERESYPRSLHQASHGALFEQLEPRVLLSFTPGAGAGTVMEQFNSLAGWVATGAWGLENGMATDSPNGPSSYSYSDTSITMTTPLRLAQGQRTFSFESVSVLETFFDYGYVGYSINSGPWIEPLALRANGTETSVEMGTLFLSQDSDVRFRFRVDTDINVASQGWSVDNLTVDGAAYATSTRDNETTVTASSDTFTYVEGSGPQIIDAGMTVTRPDTIPLPLARVSISNYVQGEDILAGEDIVENNAIIRSRFNEERGFLNIRGTYRTDASYFQEALQSVTYTNTSDNPTLGRTISIEVFDGYGWSEPAEIALDITPVNDAPIMETQVFSVDRDVPFEGQILATDVDNTTLIFTEEDPNAVVDPGADPVDPVVSNPLLKPDGSFTYTPPAGEVGEFLFTVYVSDGDLSVGPVTMKLIVDEVTALPAVFDTNEDVEAQGQLGGTDALGNPLTFTLVDEPGHSATPFELNSDGSFAYTPAANWSGPDTFTFTATTGLHTSDPATVKITVDPVNDAPVAVDGSRVFDPDAGTQKFDLLDLVSDVETDDADLLYEVNTTGMQGTLTPLGNGQFSYNPGQFIGTTSFDYRVTDTGQVGGDELTSSWETVTLEVGTKIYFDAKGKLVYVDADGDNVTVTAKGANGYVLLPGATGDAISVNLENTSSATSVSFSVKADKVLGGTGQTTVERLSSDGLIKSISGKAVTLTRDMNLNTGGATPTAKESVSISLAGVTDGSIDTNDMGIKSLTVANWADTDATPDTLDALYVDSITVKGAKANAKKGIAGSPGNFQADITTTGTNAKGLSLGKVAVAGELSGDHVLAGAAGSITVGQWVTGSMDMTFAKSISIKGKKAAKDGTGGLAGDFGVNLSFTGADAKKGVSLGKFAAAGTATGEIRTVGSIGSVSIASVNGFDLLAGIDPAAGRFPTTAADFINPDASIKSVKISGIKGQAGTFFQDSNIAAATIGSVSFCNANFKIGHSGITAMDQGTGKEIKKVSYVNKATGQKWAWPIKTGVFDGPGDFINIL